MSIITLVVVFVFFFNDTATTEIYTLSLHDALPISSRPPGSPRRTPHGGACRPPADRKSTRLNSSHGSISYAVFCLKQNIQHTSHSGRAGVLRVPQRLPLHPPP